MEKTMKRILKSGRGMLLGFTVFAFASSLTILTRSTEISALAQAPVVKKSELKDPIILEVRNKDGGDVCNTKEYVRLRVYLSGRIEGDGFTKTEWCKRERRSAVLN